MPSRFETEYEVLISYGWLYTKNIKFAKFFIRSFVNSRKYFTAFEPHRLVEHKMFGYIGGIFVEFTRIFITKNYYYKFSWMIFPSFLFFHCLLNRLLSQLLKHIQKKYVALKLKWCIFISMCKCFKFAIHVYTFVLTSIELFFALLHSLAIFSS